MNDVTAAEAEAAKAGTTEADAATAATTTAAAAAAPHDRAIA